MEVNPLQRNSQRDTQIIHSMMTKDVITAKSSDSLKWALTRMLAFDIGSIVVVDDQNTPIGILTERDIRRKVVVLLEKLGSAVLELKISEAMSSPLITLGSDATTEEATQLMLVKKIKRIPVVDSHGSLAGIVSESDLLALRRGNPTT